MMEVSSKTLPSPCRHCADATGGDPEAALALEDQDSGLLCLFKGSIFQVAGGGGGGGSLLSSRN